MQITVKQIDQTWCKVDLPSRRFIEPCLSYPLTIWKKGKFNKIKKQTKGFLMDRRANEFLSGLLPRIRQYLESQGHELNLVACPGSNHLQLAPEPVLPGYQLRPDQLKLVDAAIKHKRGVIKAPTGSGKTIVAMGLMSMFPATSRILFLIHNTSILTQTVKEFKQKGFTSIQQLGGGGDKQVNLKKRIVVSTIQTYVKEAELHSHLDSHFDLTIIDEAHHCNDLQGQYGLVMSLNQSPFKVGFTATIPPEPYKKLSLEALLGPVIGELTIEEGVELDIMAKPQIRLVPVPFESHIGDLFKYREVYPAAIVNSSKRNGLVVQEAKKQNDKGKTTLIMVKDIEHGYKLEKMAEKVFMPAIFLQGKTPAAIREQVRDLFNRKKVLTVITTAIWKEGVNIPSLNCIINACGGKSELAVLQAIGRGLRRTEDKKTVLIVDFLDPYRYLAQHTISRMTVYVQNNWL
jgi:superfamily II DNA or RNA helicase